MNDKRSLVKTSKVVLALTIILGGHDSLLTAIGKSPTNIVSAASAETTKVDGYTYSKEVLEGLNYVNDLRSKMGLSQVVLDPVFTKAAENHANYIGINGTEETHSETSTKKGFTGATILERVKAVDGTYNNSQKFSKFLEGIAWGKGLIGGLQTLTDIPYHRDALIDPNLISLGFGVSGETLVVNYGLYHTVSVNTVYPYSEQSGVPVGYYGIERPDPLSGTGLTQSGFILSYKVYDNTDKPTSSLKDSRGNIVTLITKDAVLDTGIKGTANSKFWIFIPTEVLKYNEKYTATVNNTTWSFTTEKESSGGTSTPAPTTPSKAPIVDQAAPRKFSNNDVGIRLDGKYVEVNPKAKVINGSTFIPLRGVFEAMGADVKWYSSQDTILMDSTGKIVKPDYSGVVTIKSKDGKTTIQLYIGTTRATVNGKTITLSGKPFVENGSTFVPLRFASEALGATVKWEANNSTAVILTP